MQLQVSYRIYVIWNIWKFVILNELSISLYKPEHLVNPQSYNQIVVSVDLFQLFLLMVLWVGFFPLFPFTLHLISSCFL